MSTGEEQQAQQGAEAEAQSSSLLDQAIANTKSATPDHAKDLLAALTREAMAGTVTFDKDVTRTINQAIAKIDDAVSTQLAAVMHSEAFQKLEGSWRGLNHLVMNSETGTGLKVRMLNVSKKELFKDVDKAVEFDQSQVFKKLYENEFGTPGGEPYGALIGDYEFENHPEDIELMSKMSNVAAAAFCPFLSAASPKLFGLDSYTDLAQPRDLAKIFDTPEYAPWRSFRESEDARFVTLAMPRVLARLPYGANTKPVDDFDYEEVALNEDGSAKSVGHEEYCWMNAAYVLGTRLTDSFAQTGFCTAIRGAEGGGKVEGLPAHVFQSDDGDTDLKCPTELAITDRREKELSDLGFLPLCHYKNTDYAVFFGAQSVQKPKKYDRPEATANAAISSRLPYIMATSRFTHFVKVIGRDKIGSFMEAEDCQAFLDRWIHNFVSADSNPAPEQRAKYPLREAQVEVKEIPGAPGSYNAVLHLRPWLQMEELTASMRMVARIPKMGG
jgi:type VI secretion system protein ImpC|tara:strand:+ start:1038 stop:2534 length:1497 start_codon:yes stop_codon:yes gene_type:complete